MMKNTEGGGAIARSFAKAMEQMLELERELAEKAPNTLADIRKRHGAKPKARAMNALMAPDTKLPPPERFELLSSAKKQRTRQMCGSTMCAPDNREDDPESC